MNFVQRLASFKVLTVCGVRFYYKINEWNYTLWFNCVRHRDLWQLRVSLSIYLYSFPRCTRSAGVSLLQFPSHESQSLHFNEQHWARLVRRNAYFPSVCRQTRKKLAKTVECIGTDPNIISFFLLSRIFFFFNSFQIAVFAHPIKKWTQTRASTRHRQNTRRFTHMVNVSSCHCQTNVCCLATIHGTHLDERNNKNKGKKCKSK